MKRESLFFFSVLAVAFLSLGTVIKKKDPVLETQTGPIGYAEKAKEEAEGKKGPPAPTLELYPKERFLAEGPVEKGKISPVDLGDKEKVETGLGLAEEGEAEQEDEAGQGWEGEEEFKLEAKRDDTKSTKQNPRLLDTERG